MVFAKRQGSKRSADYFGLKSRPVVKLSQRCASIKHTRTRTHTHVRAHTQKKRTHTCTSNE